MEHLSGEVIPGSLYRGSDNEYGYWHIGDIEEVVFDGHAGLFVMIRSSHGDSVQGIAGASDHAVVVGVMDALNTASKALGIDTDCDFDRLCDVVAGVTE